MIQAKITTDAGRPLILLGLEEGNIERLRKGEPVQMIDVIPHSPTPALLATTEG